jgi:hypothetical protein
VSAPQHVPTNLTEAPRRGLDLPAPDTWLPPDETHLGPRPAELGPAQPRGDGLGSPGPDQGFALRLARQFEGKLSLAEGEREADALAGAVFVALKRASLFGRAPVIHDLRVALTVWGFLDSAAPRELVEARRHLFEGAHSWHHYVDQRKISDAVPESTLRMTPDQVAEAVKGDGGWRSLLTLP